MISAGQISQFEGEKQQQLVTAATIADENMQMMELQLMGGEKGKGQNGQQRQRLNY
jgi:hypothetical protein